MPWTDFIGPILNIAGQALAKKGSDEKASAATRTQQAFATQSSAAQSRIDEVRKTVRGFIDPNVDIKSGRGAVADSGEAFRFALTGGGDPSERQRVALESLQSRLQQAQQRA